MLKKDPIKKYYLGIAVLSLISLGLIGFVMFKGISGKQDAQTLKSAQEIAEKLNDYTSQKNKIPGSLSEVGVSNSPSTITYTKKDGQSYEFCVTYKNSSGQDYGNIDSIFGGAAGFDSEYDYYSGESGQSFLYISGSYKAGKNCQVIEPYMYGDIYDSNSQNSPGELNYQSPPPSNGSTASSDCGSFNGNGYILAYGTLTKVDTSKSELTFSDINAYDLDGNEVTLSSAVFKYQTATLMCDANGKKIKASELKTSTYADFYIKSVADKNIQALVQY